MKVMAAVPGKGPLSASGKAEQKQGQFLNRSSVQDIHLLGSELSEPGRASGGDLGKAPGKGDTRNQSHSLSLDSKPHLNTSGLLDPPGHFTASRDCCQQDTPATLSSEVTQPNRTTYLLLVATSCASLIVATRPQVCLVEGEQTCTLLKWSAQISISNNSCNRGKSSTN